MTARRTCPVVGLVGGVGSGKSSLARRAAERYGVRVVDGDAAGHRALDDADVKRQLRQQFGDAIFTPDKAVDRSALAGLVFGPTPLHASAKAGLEQITHPIIRRELHDRIVAASASGAPAVLLDAAVLLEAGWREFCDVILFIDAPDELRRSRVSERGWSEGDWRRREASQLSLDEKRRHSDAVVANAGSLDEAVDALAAAVERLCSVQLLESAAITIVPA